VRILIIGSGGREHALAWKIKQSPLIQKLFIAPGNGGTALEGTNVPINDDDLPGIIAFAKKERIDLVVAGPELPLVLGLRNALERESIPCFGPGAYSAQLEGSKAFAKSLMKDAGVPTADFEVFDEYEMARDYVMSRDLPMVIKADGLAAGKGVVVARTREEALQTLDSMMNKSIFGAAGDRVVIEDALEGEEASFLVFCDGDTVVPLPSAQDHKPIGDGDTGPNTGGMGAYSPAPVLPRSEYEQTSDMVARPIINHLRSLKHPFRGVLYAGLMMTRQGIKVLEYNVRFGDPECQPLMMRLETDLVEIMLASIQGRLKELEIKVRPEPSLCVVMAAKGYPGSYPKGMEIKGIEAAENVPGVKVFQAGTKLVDGRTLTSGGRVLGVTALGADLAQAREAAYNAVERIDYENKYFRRDIGAKGLRRNER
jgi:phosphoribosylamine---glycine ligase